MIREVQLNKKQILPVTDPVLIQNGHKRRKGREKDDPEFATFHIPRRYSPRSSCSLRKDLCPLIDLWPSSMDLLCSLGRRVFQKTLDDGFGDPFFAQMEFLRWEVPNDWEAVTNIMKRTVLLDAFAVEGRIVHVSFQKKAGKWKVSVHITYFNLQRRLFHLLLSSNCPCQRASWPVDCGGCLCTCSTSLAGELARMRHHAFQRVPFQGISDHKGESQILVILDVTKNIPIRWVNAR